MLYAAISCSQTHRKCKAYQKNTPIVWSNSARHCRYLVRCCSTSPWADSPSCLQSCNSASKRRSLDVSSLIWLSAPTKSPSCEKQAVQFSLILTSILCSIPLLLNLEIDRYGFFEADADISAIHGPIPIFPKFVNLLFCFIIKNICILCLTFFSTT